MALTAERFWKAIGQSCVIIASVLIAFGIDAWWEDRQEREAELWLIERLHTDFLQMRIDLDVSMAEHRKTHSAAVQLFQSSTVGNALPRSQEMDEMVGRIFLSWWTFNPGSGSVAVFLNSDSSRIFRNRSLADQLVRWPSLIEDLQENQEMLIKGKEERWQPYLASRTDVGPYLSAWLSSMRNARVIDKRLDPSPPGFLGVYDQANTSGPTLQVNSEFLNHVLDRTHLQDATLRDFAQVSEAVDDIIELLAEPG